MKCAWDNLVHFVANAQYALQWQFANSGHARHITPTPMSVQDGLASTALPALTLDSPKAHGLSD
eukprot:738992-Pelagomonas_calceolata.AAC.2